MPLLQGETTFLLEVPLRLCYLSGMHVGKFLGDVVQRNNLGMPGLRWKQWVRQPITVRYNKFTAQIFFNPLKSMCFM